MLIAAVAERHVDLGTDRLVLNGGDDIVIGEHCGRLCPQQFEGSLQGLRVAGIDRGTKQHQRRHEKFGVIVEHRDVFLER